MSILALLERKHSQREVLPNSFSQWGLSEDQTSGPVLPRVLPVYLSTSCCVCTHAHAHVHTQASLGSAASPSYLVSRRVRAVRMVLAGRLWHREELQSGEQRWVDCIPPKDNLKS